MRCWRGNERGEETESRILLTGNSEPVSALVTLDANRDVGMDRPFGELGNGISGKGNRCAKPRDGRDETKANESEERGAEGGVGGEEAEAGVGGWGG